MGRTRTADIRANLRRYRESIYRDPDVEDEHDPAFIASQLREDSDFLAPASVRRFPFDPERVEAVIVHVQAGTEPKVTADDIRRAFVDGGTGSREIDAAVADVLSEFERPDLKEIVEWSGATPREVAAWFRTRGLFGWPVVWCLNVMSGAGQRDLPFAIEKQVLAGGFPPMKR